MSLPAAWLSSPRYSWVRSVLAWPERGGSTGHLVPALRSGKRSERAPFVAGIGSGLCVALERYHSGSSEGSASSARHLQWSATGWHGPPRRARPHTRSGSGLRFCCMLGAVTIRTVMTRRRHRRLVDLVSMRTLETGAAVLDHISAVAYCVPGIRPRIVVSAGTIELLDEAELDAVVAHERGHAHERHGLVMLPMAGISKMFSFVPYARLAPTSVAGLLEMAADDFAVRKRDPSALISALVSMATVGAAPNCAFALTGGWVSRRMERLLDAESRSTSVAVGACGAALVLLVLPAAALLAA